MRPPRAQHVGWKMKLAGQVARVLGIANGFFVALLCYIIWLCTPNPILGVLLPMFFTVITMYLFSFCSNLFGCIGLLIDHVLGTNVCLMMSRVIRFLFKIHGKLLHGYEIIGKENLPTKTGGLIVYYHNVMPYDINYVVSELYLDDNISLTNVMHRDVERISPGTCKLFNYTGKKEKVKEQLKSGGLCTAAPGGGLEAVFSENYELLWDGRIGFAEVAKECGVPIIPMFTVNGSQSMPIKIPFLRELFRKIYDQTRQIFFMPLLMFPVKLRIHFGEPIFCGADETPAQFAKRVEAGIYNLRNKYQHPESTVWSAFLERFGYRLPNASDHCAKQM